MATQDLTVMGAGVFGLAIAFEAARRGMRVRVLERERVGAGASGGLVGALAPHTPENWNDKKAFQLDSLLMAGDFWRAVEAAGGVGSTYLRSGRLQPLADQAAVDRARERAEGAAQLWQGKAEWIVRPATGAAWEPVSPSGWIVEDTLTARMAPRRAGAALAAAIRALGGVIETGETPGPGAGPVVWATGAAGLSALSADLGRDVGGPVKGQAALLALPADAAIDPTGLVQIFADAVHVVPHADGTVAIGSTSERDFDDPAATDAQLDAVIARAIAAVPALARATIVDRWAGLRPRARSRAPMLGQWPGRAGQFIANGGFKIGFGMAPKVAQVMADLVLEGRDAIPDGFRVEASLR
ncbi:FAD-dependent oxidoreductase [Aliigemmobacter aestuarii]|uniref:FAD-dependent oxidoreductase n=1 Tax=Aliigemmobacter aestuarii TaxID=1445661 RepID=A0A4S3MT70_9RHOB|nr:FAD-dependent oxidoreductase [Gemmobacter aestuarii]THD85313.1 FAD-dependent oxidoreductase [Gemmobacter aestuarii]